MPTSAIDADRAYAADGGDGCLDPHDHTLWLPFNEKMMAACRGLIVAKLPGWDCSHDVKHAIAMFETARKPITYLDVDA